MKERAQELKAGPRAGKADGESEVLCLGIERRASDNRHTVNPEEAFRASYDLPTICFLRSCPRFDHHVYCSGLSFKRRNVST